MSNTAFSPLDLSLLIRARVVVSVVLSMVFAGFANGLLYAWVPIRLSALGYDPSVAGMLIAVTAVGGFLGCFITAPLVRRLGQARAWLLSLGMLLISHGILAFTEEPLLWGLGRLAYGVAMTQLFVVGQSWFNALVTNRFRGRVQSSLNTLFVVGLGVGGFGIGFLSVDGNMAPLMALGLTIAALSPMLIPGLPRVPTPQAARVQVLRAWQISPLAVSGMLFAGGVTMLVQGYAPIFAHAKGFEPGQIGLMLLLMQLGIFGVPISAGFVSDRIDRRWVIVVCTVLIVGCAAFASEVAGLNFLFLVAAFGLWAGATEAIFSVASAQASDHAQAEEYLSLSSTLILVWSIGAALVPGVTSVLTRMFGVSAFMVVAAVLALAFLLFTLVQLRLQPKPLETISENGSMRDEPGLELSDSPPR